MIWVGLTPSIDDASMQGEAPHQTLGILRHKRQRITPDEGPKACKNITIEKDESRKMVFVWEGLSSLASRPSADSPSVWLGC